MTIVITEKVIFLRNKGTKNHQVLIQIIIIEIIAVNINMVTALLVVTDMVIVAVVTNSTEAVDMSMKLQMHYCDCC